MRINEMKYCYVNKHKDKEIEILMNSSNRIQHLKKLDTRLDWERTNKELELL